MLNSSGRPHLQITVDGDTSTNDTVLGLASGAAGNAKITDPNSDKAAALEAAVTALLQVYFRKFHSAAMSCRRGHLCGIPVSLSRPSKERRLGRRMHFPGFPDPRLSSKGPPCDPQGLAKSIAWDGEGATCLMEVTCGGAADETAANAVARSIAGSSLVKAAIYGHDPNWGRIACAAGWVAGYKGCIFHSSCIGLYIDGRQPSHGSAPIRAVIMALR